MEKINKSQLYTVLVSIRLFEYICSMDMYSREQTLGVLISLIMQSGVIALVFIFKDDVSIFQRIKSNRVTSWIYVVYLTFYGGVCFHRVSLINGETSKILDGILCTILFGVTCLYCAKLGYKSLLRSSVAVIFFVGISFIVLVYGVTSKMSMDNIYSYNDNYNVLYYALTDFAKSVDLIFLMLLMGKGYSHKEGYKYLLYRTLGIVTLSLIGLSVLGGVDIFSNYPFLTLGAYSQPFGIQRADGLYTLIITMVCVLNVSVAVILSSDLLSNTINSKHRESMIVLSMVVISYFVSGVDLALISAILVLLLSAIVPSFINFSVDVKQSNTPK